jgi:hypothetical protein
MKNSNIVKLMLVVSSSCLLAAGCAVEARGPGGEVAVSTAPDEVYAESAPPAPLVDVETPMPGPGVVWIGGAWAWESGRWQWHGGRWDHPPRAGAHWVGSHYEYRGGRHVFVRGRWR